jgi:hypothetical protein
LLISARSLRAEGVEQNTISHVHYGATSTW